MWTLGGLMMIAGPLALVAAAGSAVYYYFHRQRIRRITRGQILLYLLGLMVLVVSGWALGTIFGISIACSGPSAENLCGLIGIFGVGPLFSAISLFAFAKWWATHEHKAL